MKSLSNLSPTPGSHCSRKRLGRGPGSGLGKTSGKGHKGQKARKSPDVGAGFEGGQTPLYKRVPKFGFTNKRTKKVYNVLSLAKISTSFGEGETVNRASLTEKGLLKYKKCPIKVLASNDFNKKIVLDVDKVSAGAKSIVEKAGGTIQGKE